MWSCRLKSAVIAKCNTAAAALVFTIFQLKPIQTLRFPPLQWEQNSQQCKCIGYNIFYLMITKYFFIIYGKVQYFWTERIFTEFYYRLEQCLGCSNARMSHNILISFSLQFKFRKRCMKESAIKTSKFYHIKVFLQLSLFETFKWFSYLFSVFGGNRGLNIFGFNWLNICFNS